MRLIRTIALTALGTAALAAMASGSQATSMIPGGPLLRLSESQMSDTREMGCTCTFNRGRAAYVQMIGNEFMIRTRAGRQVCRITDRQFSNFSERTPVTCAGMSFRLRHTGRTVSHMESDSAETPSALTVTQGRTRTVLSGTWGCAC